MYKLDKQHTVVIDLVSGLNYKDIRYTAGDINTSVMNLYFTKNGEPIDLTGCYLGIFINTPSGKTVSKLVTITHAECGRANFNLPNEGVIEVGRHFMEAILFENGDKKSMAIINYNVDRSLYDDVENPENSDILNDILKELANKADKDHTHPEGGGSVDLSNLATKEELNSKADKNHTHNEYATKNNTYTKSEVDNKIAEAQLGNGEGGVNIDLSNYATKDELDTKANKTHTHTEFYTKTQVDDLLSNLDVDVEVDTSTLATKEELNLKADKANTYTKGEVDIKIAEAQLGGGEVEIDLSHLATKEELNSKADKVHNHNEYALVQNVYQKSEVYTKAEVEDLIPDIPEIPEVDLSDYATKVELETKANKEHTHTGFAAEVHEHSNYALKTELEHVHDEYATKVELNGKANEVHEHDEYATKVELSGKANEVHNHEEYATNERVTNIENMIGQIDTLLDEVVNNSI